MAPRPSLSRLTDRPDVADWQDDELVTLAEAAALFFPRGPMTANALRIAFHRGELAGAVVCGRIFTTPRGVGDLSTVRLGPGRPRATDAPEAGAGSDRRPPDDFRRRVAAARAKRGS